jgi:hypothetical protein
LSTALLFLRVVTLSFFPGGADCDMGNRSATAGRTPGCNFQRCKITTMSGRLKGADPMAVKKNAKLTRFKFFIGIF